MVTLTVIVPAKPSPEPVYAPSLGRWHVPWAEDAMSLLTETGMIAGSGGMLSPTGTATHGNGAGAV